MVPTQAIFPIDFTCKMTSRFSQNLYSGAILKVKILGFHHGPLQKIFVALLLSDPCRGVLSVKIKVYVGNMTSVASDVTLPQPDKAFFGLFRALFLMTEQITEEFLIAIG